uniref:Uncharacterized protein n=1 Tax=Anopheles minimus TaxID=112268 RepID=A0A182WNP9_9DIPT
GLNQRVRASHNISRAGFLLFLVVSGQSIGNVVAVAVLWVGVVVIGNLSNNRGSNLGHSWVSSQRSWVADGNGVSDGHDGGEDGEL